MFVFSMCSFLLRMANALLTHFTHVIQNTFHPIIIETQELTGLITHKIFAWVFYVMRAIGFHEIWCSKWIVEKIIFYLTHATHVLLITIINNTVSRRKHSIQRNRCLRKGKDLLPTCLDKTCMHGNVQLRSNHMW